MARGVLATLRRAERATRGGPLIVPMTIVRDDYHDEIIGGLRAGGVDVRHYALIASPETLRRRLEARAGGPLGRRIWGEDRWALEQVDRCVAALAGERWATHVFTDDASRDDVVEWIAADAGLALAHPRLSPGRARLRRAEVALRHIRI